MLDKMWTWLPRFGNNDCEAPKTSLHDSLSTPDKTLLKQLRTSSLIVQQDATAGDLLNAMFSEGSWTDTCKQIIKILAPIAKIQPVSTDFYLKIFRHPIHLHQLLQQNYVQPLLLIQS